MFREPYAERHLASTSGTCRDIPTRNTFFDQIATVKPESWRPGTVDTSADARRIVIKALNDEPTRSTLLVRLRGTKLPEKAAATLHTLGAGPRDAASLERPNAIAPVSRPITYATDLTVELAPSTAAVAETRAG